MYLISIYFDEKTNKVIQSYINQVAERTGNKFMTEGNVPPHITISAFETKKPEQVIEKLEMAVQKIKGGTITWASIGAFLPYVLYIAPVLNAYLHELSETIYESIKEVEDTRISPYYQPFQWLPHTTIGKKLEKEEMLAGFSVLQKQFAMIQGQVIRIGLAKTNPYEEIRSWEFMEK